MKKFQITFTSIHFSHIEQPAVLVIEAKNLQVAKKIATVEKIKLFLCINHHKTKVIAVN